MSRVGDWLARSLGRRPAPPRTVQAWFDRVEPPGQYATRSYGYGDDFWAFAGVGYSGTPVELGPQPNTERMEGDFTGLVRDGLKGNSVIYACEQRRVAVFSEAR